MTVADKNGAGIGLYSLAVGLVYMLVGGAQFVNGFIGYETWIIPGDWFQGLVLVIIGLVFSWGYVLMRTGDHEWDSYLSIGSLLAGIIFALYLFMMLANGLGWVLATVPRWVFPEVPDWCLAFEDWLEWTPMEQFQPGLWLFSVAIPGAYLTLKAHMWNKSVP